MQQSNKGLMENVEPSRNAATKISCISGSWKHFGDLCVDMS